MGACSLFPPVDYILVQHLQFSSSLQPILLRVPLERLYAPSFAHQLLGGAASREVKSVLDCNPCWERERDVGLLYMGLM